MGVIDSLSAGFRFLGKRIELLLIPILLDLMLWTAPRLSIAPLVQRLEAQILDVMAAPDIPPDVLAVTQQAVQDLDALIQGVNLWAALVNQSLLHVPSLMAGLGLSGTNPAVRSISDMGGFVFSLLLLSVVGMWIGALYLNTLARHLPLGEGSKSLAWSEFMGMVFRHWLWLLLFVVGLGVAMLLLAIPLTGVALILTAISPGLMPVVMAISSGMTLVLLFYLYFVAVGLILDNLTLPAAIWRSVLLVRYNFWPTLGFIGVTFLISAGFVQIWLLLVQAAGSSVALLAAVLGNAYIGTGLAMALLVFYRTRLLRTAEGLQGAI